MLILFIPLIPAVLALVAGVFVVATIADYFNNEPELSEIDDEDIDSEDLIYDDGTISLPEIKRKVTSYINTEIKSCKYFKIGKSGTPASRLGFYKEEKIQYTYMKLLVASSDEKLIEELEALYIDKYYDHPKNKNERKGSAGKMNAFKGHYYLYIALK